MDNVDIRELYAREAQIQQEIFFYNNEILSKVANDICTPNGERVPPHIPKAPKP